MSDETENTSDATERAASEELEVREPDVTEIDDSKSAPEDRATTGPFDVSEVPAMRPYVDLGGIKVAPREGLQMRLEVDERAQRVVAASLNYAESMLQVQAFSAPKSSGLWNQVRAEIAQQMESQGSEVSTVEGELGPELLVRSQATAEQGGGTRVVRFIGVDGPRWLLRGVVMGKAALDADAREKVTALFREVVVVRGDQPMPPSELLQLQVPAGVKKGQAQQNGAPGGAQQV
ncbi:MAG: DUF3710 domain-containing protein [Leucobacter sp.]